MNGGAGRVQKETDVQMSWRMDEMVGYPSISTMTEAREKFLLGKLDSPGAPLSLKVCAYGVGYPRAPLGKDRVKSQPLGPNFRLRLVVMLSPV